MSTQTIDEQDQTLISARMRALDEQEGPRVGDYVRFADGTLRRCSYHWTDDTGWDGGMQTSDGGRFHLGDYGCSFSGALYSTVPTESLELTDERRPGWIWIFHHDYRVAGGGRDVETEFRVYHCALEPPR